MIVYGLSLDEIADHSAPASGQTFDPERTRYTHLHGDRWSVALWDVPVAHWASVTDTFRDVREIIRRGCVVAWVGAEGFLFSDPPHLFDPAFMSGGVLAWGDGVRRLRVPDRTR